MENYGRECFKFTENFLRMTFIASKQVALQVEELIKVLEDEMDHQEIQRELNLSNREHFRLYYLKLKIYA